MSQQTTFTDQDLVGWGQRTLKEEAQALLDGSQRLDLSFAQSVRTLLAATGKVVVSGLGKSGYVGRKIAATFASTGTTACFLHPVEALHGDIGMLSPGDVLVAIAFGGETREVISVAQYARRLNISIIAITGRRESTLAQLADHRLDANVDREACPLNLAPTTSSTLTLALGDALAVALIEARGFETADFARLHPGGSLGTKLSLVAEHLRPYDTADFLRLESRFGEILTQVTRHNFGIAPVVSATGALLGCITDGDVRRAVHEQEGGVFQRSAKDLMSYRPKIIGPTALAMDAVRIMEAHGITSLFVVEADRTLGIVRLHDLLLAKIV